MNTPNEENAHRKTEEGHPGFLQKHHRNNSNNSSGVRHPRCARCVLVSLADKGGEQ